MTDSTAPRHKGMRTIALVTIIALVVGIGGGWLVSTLTSSDEPSSVWATRADGGSLVGGALTLTAVGNSVVKVDTATQAAVPTDTVAFFGGWAGTFGDEPVSAVVTALSGTDEVQLVLELTNPDFSEIGYVVIFDANVVSGSDEVRNLSNVTLLIDGD
jgi:hypothetical protein